MPFATMECARTRDKLPADFTVHKRLGKGANNCVLSVQWDGQKRAMRVPRRGSDTQQRGSATWEHAQTMRAAELNVAPAVHAAWYARHAEDGWASGLYMVMDQYDTDLDSLMIDNGDVEGVEEELLRVVDAMARERMFLFDLKPSNVVVRRGKNNDVEVRIIDFGRDFCEWHGDDARARDDVRAPIAQMLERRHAADLVTHLLFAAMLVQLGATTTCAMHAARHEHRMSSAARRALNPLATACTKLLESMRGENIARLRELLRTDEVKGVLKHYHGRRCSGTHRTLRYAQGIEVP